MLYSNELNIFFITDTSLTNSEKIEKLKQLEVTDAFTLLRNIEENPIEFDAEIIKETYAFLRKKGIMCV